MKACVLSNVVECLSLVVGLISPLVIILVQAIRVLLVCAGTFGKLPLGTVE